MLFYFLDGKAYNFYIQKVSRDEENWTLTEFYTELYNFCFPINYRMQMRRKLDKFYQNDKTVSEYTHELEELFNTIGSVGAREQVIKFWKSSRPSIQQALWQDGLNPDISSWDEVVCKAEIIEISENVMKAKDSKKPTGSNNKPSGNSNQSLGNSSSYNNKSTYSNSKPSRSSNQGNTSKNNHNKNSNSNSNGNNHKPKNDHSNKKNTSGPTLSEKEKAEWRADGHCFNCDDTGHMSRNCPKQSTVKHNGNKPPGTTIHNLEPVDKQVNEDGEPEMLESLPFGAIEIVEGEIFSPLTDFIWETSDSKPCNALGDCFSLMATQVLLDHQPYPGDKRYSLHHDWDFSRKDRFIVYWKVKQGALYYYIYDVLTRFGIHVDKKLLDNPAFDLGGWYAKRCAQALSLCKPKYPWAAFG